MDIWRRPFPSKIALHLFLFFYFSAALKDFYFLSRCAIPEHDKCTDARG